MGSVAILQRDPAAMGAFGRSAVASGNAFG